MILLAIALFIILGLLWGLGISKATTDVDFDKDWGSFDHYIRENAPLGYKPKPLQWFLDRIGKKVYRDVLECDCASCREVEKDGLLITNETHASYLCAIDQEFWAEGVKCNYRDEK